MYDGYPYSASGKLTQNFEVGKKSVGVPLLISLFQTCTTFEAGGGPTRKKNVCPPMVWFGLTPMVYIYMLEHSGILLNILEWFWNILEKH